MATGGAGEEEEGEGEGKGRGKGGPRSSKRFRRMKIRYVGTSKQAVEAIEEAYGNEVEFLS
jgi:hypothetical protein